MQGKSDGCIVHPIPVINLHYAVIAAYVSTKFPRVRESVSERGELIPRASSLLELELRMTLDSRAYGNVARKLAR